MVITLNIKQRLFISNILMIILPIIFTITMSFAIYFVFAGTTGMDPFSIGQNRSGVIIADELTANIFLYGEAYTQTATVVVYQLESGSYLLVLPESISEHLRGQGIPPYIPIIMFIGLLIILFPVKHTEKICVRLGRLGANFFAP